MARKRLNKKVVLVGSAVLAIVMVIFILLILHQTRDPKKFIIEGDAAVKAVNEATDKDIKMQECQRAERSYHRARARAKSDSVRIDVLFKLVDLYLEMDKYTEADQWRYAIGCLNQIINIDPKNIAARLGELNYFYIMADSGVNQVWQEVSDKASVFIEMVKNSDILMEDIAKWEILGMPKTRSGKQRLGPWLYLIRGQANLELARMGAVTNPYELLAKAVDDLEKAQEYEPDNIDVYWYLAQVAYTKANILASRGSLEEKDKAIEQAKEYSEQAVKTAEDNPKAHINLLLMKLTMARRSGKEQIQSLEPEFLSLLDKFPSSAEVFSIISRFYLNPLILHKNLDKAIEAAEEALRLDKKNVTYAMVVADLYYRRFSYHGQKSDVYKAIETAKNALTLPDAQEKGGPRSWANRVNKVSLCVFLAKCYIGQILEPCEQRSDSETAVWLRDAEQVVHEIEQIVGSGEDPQVVKWRGMLELAKGNKELAIRKLYATYEQLEASARPDALLSYTLARLFKNTSEVGAVMEFLISSLQANIAQTKPEAALDYAEVLLKLNAWTATISNINSFEESFGSNERSKILRIKAYIGANQLDEVEVELAKLKPDDPDTIQLELAMTQVRINQIRRAIRQKQTEDRLGIILQQAEKPEIEGPNEPGASVPLMTEELDGHIKLAAELVRKLLPIEPNYVQQATITSLCAYYIEQGKISDAKDLVGRFLHYFPDSIAVLINKQILSEPEPGNISQQRRKEIEEYVLSNITDPTRRAVDLGLFYRRNNEMEKAAAELKKVLKTKPPQESATTKTVFEQAEETNLQSLAADYLLDVAIEMEDWELAGQIVETAQSNNLDKCQGQVFASRFDLAKGDFKNALVKIDECLKQRPLFSHAYMLRSSINAKLESEHASIADIRKAASLNPLDGNIARVLAITLYRRNQNLGDNASAEQIGETSLALERARALNLNDLQLLNFYADYISKIQPLRALLLRQNIQKTMPSVQNAVQLGKLSTKLAVEETNAERRQALFAIAAASFEQAKKMDPDDREMLYGYAEYYRAMEMGAEAEKILQESKEPILLWNHYLQSGQFEKAKEILGQLYESNPKDIHAIKGLLLVAEKTLDGEAAKRYSEKLLSIQGSVENHLLQIQVFLKVGLIDQAEHKLQSFNESHPDEPRAVLLGAWLLTRRGQLEKAMELVNQILQSDQNNGTAWKLRGQISLLMANYEQAIGDLGKSKSLSDEPDIRLNLARAYLRMNREDDAITELKNIIDVPGCPKEARMLLERIYLRLGRKDALRKLYDDTLEKFPNNVSWYNLAGASAIADNDFERAERLYKEAYLLKQKEYLKQDVDNTIPDREYVTAFDGYLQALVLGAGTSNSSNWQPQKLDKVLEEGSKHVAGSLAPIAFYRMAEAKMKLGEEKVAIEYCRKAVDEAQTNEMLASEILLKMFLLLGPEDVSEYCSQKLSTNPDSLAANWTMFNLANINADYDKAIDYLDKCIKIAGPDTPRGINYVVKKVETLTLAFEKTSDNNYLKQGIADYESLLAKMPNNTNVLNNLAYMLVENDERLFDALRYAEQVVEAVPNNPGFLDTYAYVLYKNGKLSQAAESVAAALQQYEQSGILPPADVYVHAGMIKEELGAKEQALDAYKQALEIGADRLSQGVREKIKKAIERLSQ